MSLFLFANLDRGDFLPSCLVGASRTLPYSALVTTKSRKNRGQSFTGCILFRLLALILVRHIPEHHFQGNSVLQNKD